MDKTFYITTPIYYANSLPHLGHLYTTIVADVIQRYKKQRGFDTRFLTGTDEHGINIQRAAERNNRSPKAQVDFVSDEMKKMFAEFGLDKEHGGYDIFMRTSEPFHYEGVQHFWREIAKNKTPKGNETIYKGFYEGWFCAPCAAFKTQDEYIWETSSRLLSSANSIIEITRTLFNQGVISKSVKDALTDNVLKFLNEHADFLITFDEAKLLFGINEKLPDKQVNKLNLLLKEKSGATFLEVIKQLSIVIEEYLPKEVINDFQIVLITFIESIEKENFFVPLCKIHERPLDKVAEESYFFRLSDYDEILLEIIEKNPQLIRPESRRNEVFSFIKSGLQDLSISREKKSVWWGVPVPDDENHTIYLWVDALSNYITALGYGNAEKSGFENYWQNAHHIVGKDILRFHTVYWFSFLLAAGIDLPKSVFAHGMWLDADGRKMGKTLGNVIELEVLRQHFSNDAIRYFVLREMVFGGDGKFGYENLIERANADLASGLGNLSSRTLSMITKYRDSKIPNGKISEAHYLYAKRAGINPDEQDLVSVLDHARDEFLRRFDNFEFSQALEILWNVIARIDKMISDAKPWELVKDENQAESLNLVLYRASETLRWLCVLLYPIMPEATRNIYAQIGLSEDIATLNPENLVYGELQAETKIGETSGVFPRIDKNKVMNEIGESKVQSPKPKVEEKVTMSAEDQPSDEEKSHIDIEDFLKVELRVGEILVAERIPKADKLLRFEIDLGEEKPRQILAGLAEYYEPETLIGRKVVVVANLKPRMMRGLESQGMICAASLENSDDTPAIATFLEDVKIGARLK